MTDLATQASVPCTYVLDTSVLLADPRALLRFAEQEVVLPLVVISELEGKRHHPEIGVFARQALRILDDLRIRHGRLDVPFGTGLTMVRTATSDDMPLTEGVQARPDHAPKKP